MIHYLLVLILGMTTVANSFFSDPYHGEKEHKVVIQVSKVDPAAQLKVIGQIKNILEALPNTKIEVVCHSEGLPILVITQSKVPPM